MRRCAGRYSGAGIRVECEAMWITSEQAAEMYAQFCRARYGSEAFTVARKRASELRRVGDLEGERIWNRVAAHICPEEARPKLYSAA